MSVGSSEGLITFWLRWQALPRSGMRELNAPPTLSVCGEAHTDAWHLGARDVPELGVYCRGTLGLVKLVLRFGRVGRRDLEVEWVKSTLHL